MPGGRRPNQDRIRTTKNAAILLDGASAVRPQRFDGGWYANHLADELCHKLEADPDAELRTVLRDAIAKVASELGHDDGSPSSTVAMVRWSGETVDLLILGDSVAVIYYKTGSIEVLQDTRLDQVGVDLRRSYADALRKGQGFTESHRERLKELQAEQLRLRNRPDGFWIAATEPGAADEAWTCQLPTRAVEAVLLASDGFADGVLTYGVLDWAGARQMVVERGAEAALGVVQGAESQDSDGRQWPRGKAHDDKSLVLVEFKAL
ncbi:protein phosphatase 2C domain-containing protein [Actinoplanes sp. NPDC004185]